MDYKDVISNFKSVYKPDKYGYNIINNHYNYCDTQLKR